MHRPGYDVHAYAFAQLNHAPADGSGTNHAQGFATEFVDEPTSPATLPDVLVVRHYLSGYGQGQGQRMLRYVGRAVGRGVGHGYAQFLGGGQVPDDGRLAPRRLMVG